MLFHAFTEHHCVFHPSPLYQLVLLTPAEYWGEKEFTHTTYSEAFPLADRANSNFSSWEAGLVRPGCMGVESSFS